MINLILYAPILNFWFSPLESETDFPKDKAQTWFFKNPSFDQEIKDNFYPLFDKASSGELNHWLTEPKGKLAFVILCDQFSRNVFRGSEKSFAYDPLALSVTLKAIEDGDDLSLLPLERSFFYLPLEHSEDPEIQKLSIRSFEKLLEDAPESQKDYYATYLKYALDHKAIIDRFGRYPHRNETLGRESTQEEIKFLKEPGSSF